MHCMGINITGLQCKIVIQYRNEIVLLADAMDSHAEHGKLLNDGDKERIYQVKDFLIHLLADWDEKMKTNKDYA